jgi:hypothetical protein
LEKEIESLNNQIEKDKFDLEKEKKEFISIMKNIKKEDIITKKEKINLWERIRKVLTGF